MFIDSPSLQSQQKQFDCQFINIFFSTMETNSTNTDLYENEESLLVSSSHSIPQENLDFVFREFLTKLQWLKQRIYFHGRALINNQTFIPSNDPFDFEAFEQLSTKLIILVRLKTALNPIPISNFETLIEPKHHVRTDNQNYHSNYSRWQREQNSQQMPIQQILMQMNSQQDDSVLRRYLQSVSWYCWLPKHIQREVQKWLRNSKKCKIGNKIQRGGYDNDELQQKDNMQQDHIQLQFYKSDQMQKYPSHVEEYQIGEQSEEEKWKNIQKSFQNIKALLNHPLSLEENSICQKYCDYEVDSITGSEHMYQTPCFISKFSQPEPQKILYQIPIQMIVNQSQCQLNPQVLELVIAPEPNKKQDESLDLFSLKISESNPVQLVLNSSSQESKTDREIYFNKFQDSQHTSIHPKFEESVDFSELIDLNDKLTSLNEEKIDLIEQVRNFDSESTYLKRELNVFKKLMENNQKEKEKQTKKIKEEILKLQMNNSYLKKELKIKEERMKEFEDEKEMYTTDKNNALMKIFELEKEQKRLKLKLQENQKTVSKTQKQAESYNIELNEREEYIRQIEQLHQQQKRSLENELYTLETEKQQMKEQMDKLQAGLQEKAMTIYKLQIDYEELVNELAISEEDRSTLYGEELQKMRENHAQELNKKETEINQVKGNNEKLTMKVHVLEKEKAQLQFNNQLIKNENQMLEQRIEEEKLIVQSQKERLNEQYEEEFFTLRRAIITSAQELDEKNHKIMEMQSKTKQLQLQDRSSVYEGQLENIIVLYEKQIRCLFDEVQNLRKYVESNERQIQLKDEEIDELQTDLFDLVKLSKETQKENKRLKKVMNCTQNKLSNINDRLNTNKLVSLVDEIDVNSHTSSTIKFRYD